MSSEEDVFLPPEYTPNTLVVMARASHEGLRRATGGAVALADLPIPRDLAERLCDWAGAFTAALAREDDPARQDMLSTFTAMGLAIARQIQAVLGSAYQILYFDEAKLEAEAWLTDYLYPAGLPDD